MFSVPSGEVVQDAARLAEQVWSSWNTVLGPEMAGVWPAQATKADVNCADVNKAGNAVVTGDDFGFVKLFAFPAFDQNVCAIKKSFNICSETFNAKVLDMV